MELLDRPAGDPSPPEVSALEAALAELDRALGDVVKLAEDGCLAGCDDPALVGFMQGFERVRNRLPLVDHQVVLEAGARGLAEAVCQGSLTRMLVAMLRLSPAEASRRVRAAEAVGERVSLSGEVLAPVRPVLAAAQRVGEVSAEQVGIVERALARVDRRGFDPAEVAAGEELLTGFAAAFGPRELRGLAERVVAGIDPDGSVPDEEVVADRRFLELRQGRDGSWCGQFRLTGPAGAKLQALLGPLARARLDRLAGPDGAVLADGALPDGAAAGDAAGLGLGGVRGGGGLAAASGVVRAADQRSHGQRMHDALEEVCDRLLRDGIGAGRGGVPATVIVRVDAETLRSGRGVGVTSDGTVLSARQMRRVADEAEVYVARQDGRGVVLDLFRTRRLASRGQTIALVARDGGCSFPGCDRAPEWCERHHIVDWADGGETNLDNLTLLCAYHHHHFAARGWTCRLNRDRLPEWRPPRWVDPQQRPLLNGRIQAVLTARRNERLRQ